VVGVVVVVGPPPPLALLASWGTHPRRQDLNIMMGATYPTRARREEGLPPLHDSLFAIIDPWKAITGKGLESQAAFLVLRG